MISLRLTVLLSLLICLSSTTLWSQTDTCGLQRATQQHRSGFLPILGGNFADAELEVSLTHSFNAIFFQLDSTSSEPSLHAALNQAQTRKNRCAEGLAAYGLGLIAHRHDIAAATSWFHQAEAAFTEAHAQAALAHTDFELATLVRNSSSPAEISAAFTAAAHELDKAGDPFDALLARLEAVPISSPEAPAQFAILVDQARTLNAPEYQAKVLQVWGDAEYSHGQYDQAMQHYQHSDALYSACLCDFDQRAYLQTSMGRLERVQGRPTAAIHHYEFALRLQTQTHDPSYIPQTLNAISVAYETMHQYQKAIFYVQRALTVAHQIHSQPFIDFLEANLGNLYYQAGQPTRGLPYLQRATAHLSSDYQRCSRYNQLSELYRATGQLQNAEDSITKSIAACDSTKDNRSLSESYETRARIRLQRTELDGALSDAREALTIVETIRAHLVPEDAHKRGYNEATLNIFETTIAILARMNRFPEALEVTEQARSRAFLDLLSSPHAPLTPTTTTPSLIKVSSPRGTSTSSPPSNDLLLQSESHTAAMSTDEIVDTAERLHSTILAYWLSKDALYTWVVRPGQPIYGISQPIKPSTLEALVRSTNPSATTTVTRGLRTRGGHTMALAPIGLQSWSKLYQILIAPISSHLPQEPASLLTIIPSGPLFELPFAALLDPSNHYLIERYALHTVPAAGLLRYTEKNEAAASLLPSHYLFIANPQHLPLLANSSPLPPLPGTDAEVKAIASILPANEVTLLEGTHADATDLAAALASATVLHFATHAIVSDSDPFGSFLALDRSPTKLDDGKLTAASIYHMNLHTHLVVLSACRTGLGPISGDGVAGLSRAFFYAGSASVLTTLWDVADQPTALLMPLFYQGIAQGEPRSIALRNAQLALLADLRHHRLKVRVAGHDTPLPEEPAFWAAFSLSGQP